jgi:glutaredoxin 3
MTKVEIYVKFMCPYCARAIAIFKSKNITVKTIDITMDSAKRAEMIARSEGRTTVPQIFINDVPIGGSDDLVALDRAGKLDPLLVPA